MFGTLINFVRRTYATGQPPAWSQANGNADQAAIQAVCDWADLYHAAAGGTPDAADSIWYWSVTGATIKAVPWSTITGLATTAQAAAQATAAGAMAGHVAAADPHTQYAKETELWVLLSVDGGFSGTNFGSTEPINGGNANG